MELKQIVSKNRSYRRNDASCRLGMPVLEGLPDWPGPGPSERPSAYVVVLLDATIAQAADVDVGIAAQTLLLGAVERGLGGCMFRTEFLRLPDHPSVTLVIALGKPVEKIVLEDCPPGGAGTYYREADQTHHVPKRRLDELIHARL